MDLAKCIRISARAAVLLLVFSLVYINPGCKDPNDFKPDDSIIPPPAAPRLLLPPDSFVRMPPGSSNRLLLNWEAVQDAEIYEIRLDGDSIPGWTIQYDTNYLNMRIDKEPGFIIDKFTWKVRAGSSKWEYYTDWSEPKRFEIRYRPPPPQLLSPSNDTTLIFESLPAAVILDWMTVQDERFYNVSIYIDSFLIAEVTVPSDSYEFTADTVGVYFWQVRAGNPHWEFSTEWTELRKFTVRTAVQ